MFDLTVRLCRQRLIDGEDAHKHAERIFKYSPVLGRFLRVAGGGPLSQTDREVLQVLHRKSVATFPEER